MGRVASARVGEQVANGVTRGVAGRLDRRTTGELVAEHVRQMIFAGTLRTGDRIPQDLIAAELGVSRLPVREAVIELARDGLVTVEPHTGAFVAPFDAEVLRQHFEIVGLVQGLAAAALATAADPATLAELDALVAAIDAATRAGDADAAHAATMEFLRVMNLSGGSVRQQAVLRALARMLPTGFFADVPGGAESERQGAHRILAAIRSRSPDDARDACVAVQRAHADLVIAFLRDRGVFAATEH